MTSTSSPSKEATAPASGKIELNGKLYEPIKEGLATILKPVTNEPEKTKPRGSGVEQQASVFYNPIQQFNRDLSVIAIKVFADHFVALAREKIENKRRKKGGKNKKRKREDDNDEKDNEAEVSRETKKRHEGNDAVAKGENGAEEIFQDTKAEDQKGDHATNGDGEMRPVNFQILDALSATGLRALRYAKEIPLATKIVSNDLSATAIEAIKANVKYNEVENVVRPNVGDARAYLYSLQGDKPKGSESIGKFDVIDLDPYGTAAPFLDASIQGLSDGGLLCVTCTDAGVFASTGYPEKAFSLYGGVSCRMPHGHEIGLRLILNAIATTAARYGLSVEPLLSLSIDYYARVFVRVHKSPFEVKFLSGKTMLVYNCDAGCGAWTTQYLTHTKCREGNKDGHMNYHYSLAQAPTASPSCEHCGFRTHLGGPMWGGPLHNPHFIRKVLNMLPELDPETYVTMERIEGMLTTALEEDLDLNDSPSQAQSQAQSTEDETEAATIITTNSKQDEIKPDSPIIPRLPAHIQDKHPFFVSLSALSKVLHTHTIPMNSFRGALHGLGYRTTRSHTRPNSVRTDAPWDVIWEIMREWARQENPHLTSSKDGARASLRPGTPGAGIMKKDRSHFDKNNKLVALKKEIENALAEGQDISDLTTKVEAALYRGGQRHTASSAGAATTTEAVPVPDDTENRPIEAKLSAKAHNKKQERPHPNTLEIVFDESIGREFSTSAAKKRKRIARYPQNPEANWGPMSKATGH